MSHSGDNLLQQLDYSVLQQCMHCGMCLPTCPTYDATKRETSSPRGRIQMMRAVADGKLDAASPLFSDEMYFCLGCLACETACPAGVQYGEMIEYGRAEVESTGIKTSTQRDLVRAVALKWLFGKPNRLRSVAKLMRLDQRTGLSQVFARFMSPQMRELHSLQPRICDKFSFELIREVEQPDATRHRVGLLTGCVQDVAYSHINRDTVDVLLANGCEVVTPRGQGCCGSLMGHNGELEHARKMARHILDLFPLESLDAVITNAAGCGSFLKRYRHLLPDDPRAKAWDQKVCDIHEWLMKIGLRPPKGSLPERVTYHDACHLAHGQKITRQPRELLRAIPGLELVELPEATWCCGSAGIYNITQPDMSMALLERKMKHITGTGALIVATANPGCIGQIVHGIRQRGLDIKVAHPISLLAQAYRNG
jgi:glycolate oxidase iron-sulfur subunit